MINRVVIFGAGGQLGMALQGAFAQAAPQTSVLALDRSADLTEPSSWHTKLDAFKPDIIVNAAAFTAVDACEADPDRAFRVNCDGVASLARWCASADAVLIHISTDYVFGDQSQIPRQESDPVGPLNAYGLSKEAGEAMLRTLLPRHIIARTSWIYGKEAGNFFATMMKMAETKDNLKVVADEASCPTYAPDLAAALVHVCSAIASGQGHFGTFHCAGAEGLSRYQFAKAIMAARAASGKRIAQIEPITQADYGAPARRPIDSRMDCTAFKDAYGLVLPGLNVRLPTLMAALANKS